MISYNDFIERIKSSGVEVYTPSQIFSWQNKDEPLYLCEDKIVDGLMLVLEYVLTLFNRLPYKELESARLYVREQSRSKNDYYSVGVIYEYYVDLYDFWERFGELL